MAGPEELDLNIEKPIVWATYCSAGIVVIIATVRAYQIGKLSLKPD